MGYNEWIMGYCGDWNVQVGDIGGASPSFPINPRVLHFGVWDRISEVLGVDVLEVCMGCNEWIMGYCGDWDIYMK